MTESVLADSRPVSDTRHFLLRRVALYAALLGVAADLLLRQAPWGLHLALWLAVGVGATWDLTRRQARVEGSAWLLLVASVFAVLALGRASPPLAFFNAVAVFLAAMLHIAASADPRFFARGAAELEEVVIRLVRVAFAGAIGAYRFLTGSESLTALFPTVALRIPGGSLAGALATIVLAVAMTAILAAGDAVFGAWVKSVLRFDFEVAFEHVALIVFVAWGSAGVWRYAVGSASPSVKPTERSRGHLSMMPLTALAVLLGVFVISQLRTLIGGAEYVRRVTGLTLAEYARNGFFALCFAAAIALAVALWYQSRLRVSNDESSARFRIRALVLATLLGLLTAGAMVRMWLYVDAFGLTVDRLYASIVMVWLVFLAAWLAWCAWGGRSMSFVRGALLSAWSLLLLLNVVNPEAFIVRVNAARAERGAEFDFRHAALDLSADAVPALVDALVSRNVAGGSALVPCDAQVKFITRWDQAAERALPTWRWAEHRAFQSFRQHEAQLRGLACAPTPPKAPSGN